MNREACGGSTPLLSLGIGGDLESWGAGGHPRWRWAGGEVRSLRMAELSVPQGEEGLSPWRLGLEGAGGLGGGRSREAGVEMDTERSYFSFKAASEPGVGAGPTEEEPERKGKQK